MAGTEEMRGLVIEEFDMPYYFTTHDGKTFYQRGISGTPEELPQGMSYEKYRDFVMSKGIKVTELTTDDIKKALREHEEYRREADGFLNRAWYTAAGSPKPGMKGH